MKNKIKTFKFKKPINLYCFTDVHLGAVDHDAELFHKALEMLKKDKDGYCFFNGDNMEFIPKDYGIDQRGQSEDLNQQVKGLITIFKSLKEKVLFFRGGNHEERMLNIFGLDINQLVYDATKVPLMKYTGYEIADIYINGNRTRLVTSHGSGASKTVLARMKESVKGGNLYFCGHTHEFYCDDTKLQIDVDNNGFEVFQPVINMVGGSFLKFAEYARNRNMVPTQTGCYVLRIDEKGISVKGRIK